MKTASSLAALVCGALLGGVCLAKLPPLSDEAKAKAAEATAKTGHGNKLADYKLCLSMDKVASTYFDQAKKAGKTAAAPNNAPACTDPGPFVAASPAPAGAAPAAAPAASAAAVAKAAQAAAPAKK